MNFGENIKQLRISKNMTQDQVSEILGIKQSSYVSWEKKSTNPTLELVEKLAQLYRLPIEKIIDKNDHSSNQASDQKEERLLKCFHSLDSRHRELLFEFSELLLKQKRDEALPVISLASYKRSELDYAIVEDELLSAGYGKAVSNTGEHYKAYTTKTLSRYDGAARINGNSMEPEFPNFSIATFLQTGFSRDGDIYAISEGGLGEEELYIKQVFKEKDRFRIHSLNPDYKDFYLGQDDEFRIIGPVVDHFVEIEEDQIEDE